MNVRKPFRRPWPSRDKTGRRAADLRPEDLRRAQSELRQEQATVAAIERIARVIDRQAEPAEALAEIAWIAADVTNTDAAQIFLLQPDGEHLRLEADSYEPDKVGRVVIKVGQGLTGWAAKHKRPVSIRREPWRDPRFFDYPGLDEHAFQSLLCVPLILDEELLGVVNVRTRRQYGYTEREADILSRIAEQVARAIRQQTRVATLETRAERYRAVSEVSELIGGSPYLEEILQLLVSFTAERLNYKVVTVRLLDEQRNQLVLRATQSTNYAYRKKRSIKVGESFAGRAIIEKRPLVSEDVQKDPEYIGAEMAEAQGLRSMACVPLLIRDKAIGVMTCYTDQPRPFSKPELHALESLAKQAAIAIEHAKLRVRTTLMRELHHRLKNNLQQVASLLRLQLDESAHRSVDEVINDSLARIQAIASVHDLLSREDLDRVGIRTIAETLAHHHQQALVLPGRSISVSVEGDDVPLGMAQATQVALILNELLTNALDHGFREGDEGEVDVCIKARDDFVYVWVANSGRCLHDDFDIAVDSHLGLKIVDSLARGVGGRFRIRNRYGWVVAEVVFPNDEGELG